MNKKQIKRIIYNWVGKNYGESEAEAPSWDIDVLAHEIASELRKASAKKLFVVEAEALQGYPTRFETQEDGEPLGAGTPDSSHLVGILLGYRVYELDERGAQIKKSRYYPVQTISNEGKLEDSREEVLAQIKRDFPADKWQNMGW